jgi:Eukaryotic aspartyl protease
MQVLPLATCCCPSSCPAMHRLFVSLLCAAVTVHAAVLPPFEARQLHSRFGTASNRPRSLPQGAISVPIELIGSAYCGNASIGSQSQSIPILYDLNAAQLSALSQDVNYCNSSGACLPQKVNCNAYDPSSSSSARNSSEAFEISISNLTLSGDLFDDTVSLGGISSSWNVLLIITPQTTISAIFQSPTPAKSTANLIGYNDLVSPVSLDCLLATPPTPLQADCLS